ncbi:hypothetical protein [Roseibacillus persicicus]|uniref:hypothetical protein n=1 Tax=Roseibacillus persicicus TaxID=454148 RepID=UPI0028104A0F|nr:hypothetical protein [Roseibacillus persicicus]MDQ8190332.1 hypothetical protein [Roseibacillus persicicus]
MADRSKSFQSAVLLFALILLIFLFTAITLSFLPQDLSDVDGRNADGSSTPPTRNLERVLENAASQGIKVTLTEEEINQWLSNQIQGTQDGLLKNQVQYRGAWVRLKEGSVDLIFEREAFNRTHTIAMNVQIEQLIEGNNQMSSNINWAGGRLGQMPVMQGYLALVMSSYEELAEVMKPEVKSLRTLLEGKALVKFEEGKVTFEPRSSSEDLGMPVF